MTPAIAIVGMACCYPDARSPEELWENVLAQRQAFRRIPPERLCLDDYLSADRNAPDCTYVGEAALIEGYEFDRVRFRVAGSTFRTADLSHWLALDVAVQALHDAGFPEGEGLPRDTTGVLLGNTLTGEFARANLMRLRWPYVHRTVEAALGAQGWPPAQRRAFLAALEAQYKAPFPPVGEESLAGGMSNTIAGRICNHFDLKGGGYTVDGACAASLLAITTACSALVAGDLDVALAGGVDISLDPFELVGFAKAGALAPEEMRVYDARSAGFWPGEGCGFVVLMRHADAVAQARRIYAVIRGWGVSSDGSGGLTRPEVAGQLLALQRAYRRACFGVETVTYFEGHGTGTSVGDAIELQVLSQVRQEASPAAPPAVLGSVKANIGHTKAAAGIAGLIKATMALYRQILPPTTGCEQPHAVLTAPAAALQVLPQGLSWPAERLLRAGVSAMGFGGVNAHVVLEGAAPTRHPALQSRECELLRSAQDAELVLLGGSDRAALQRQIEHLLTYAARLSRSEVTDLAAHTARTLEARQVRAALVAASPAELVQHLATLRAWLTEHVITRLDTRAGIFLGTSSGVSHLGLLFPGQGAPAHCSGGVWRRRFPCVQDLYARQPLPAASDGVSTAVAQPAIVMASLAALEVLMNLGVTGSIAIGHSLGELTALHWAGAFDAEALLRLATVRGKAMAALRDPTGAMASLSAVPREVERLAQTAEVVIAGFNAPRQTVISGEASAVAAVVARARGQGVPARLLPVSHAFHSPLMAAAIPALAQQLDCEACQPLHRPVVSTVTGAPLACETDVRALLCRQVTAPVRFVDAIMSADRSVDLWLEVGPGRVLSGLLTYVDTPAIALDAGGASLRGVLQAVGAAFALGAPVDPTALFAERFVRPFDLAWQPRFFVNPCELAPRYASGETPPTLCVPQGVHKPTVSNLRKSFKIKTLMSHLRGLIVPRRGMAACQAVGYRGGSPHLHTSISDVAAGFELGGRGVQESGNITCSDSETQRLGDTTAATSALAMVRELVAERAELPVNAVRDDSRLLRDLHLNSIAVGQVVAEAARRLGLPPPVAPTDYADTTVAGAAQALEDLLRTGGAMSVNEARRWPSGVDTWIRAFTVELVERPLPQRQPSAGEGMWRVLAPAHHPLATSLQQAFLEAGGEGGVVVCLPPTPEAHHVRLLLEGARAVCADTPTPACQAEGMRFVLVQHGGGAAAFARTLHLEAPQATTCVVDVPMDHPQAVEWVLAEARTARGYVEAHYDATGKRYEPVLRLLPMSSEPATPPLGPDDVLVVTGGGKGIAAECALALARETGVRLALLGRSQPDADAELAANLARMAAAGITCRYLTTDVTDAAAVRAALGEIEVTLGPITAILHAAGTNIPQLLSSLDEAAFQRTLAPKVQGAQNLLAAVNPERLRLFVVFGSLIARTGMRGEADYALANEWLTRLTERVQAEHPACRCLALEWSIWSGVGMGERLGRVDALMREGITPITPETGIAMLQRLLAQPLPAVAVVVTGRWGEAPTLRMAQQDLPFLRFLEQPQVYYPGIELVVDAVISVETDPYLQDHVYQGECLLPAVIGLEAMAQAAMALVGSPMPPVFEAVRFSRPVVVLSEVPVTIRVAALRRESGQVEIALRSAETAFQVDHFRATCRFGMWHAACRKPSTDSQDAESIGEEITSGWIDPARDLYGKLLFQSGRFRRLRGYRRLRATECVAEVAPGSLTDWFGRYLPAQLVLGDPAARDTAIHAIQACIPHATLLPIGVDRFVPGTGQTPGTWYVHAWERAREGSTFTYDLEVLEANGDVREQWEGLRLRLVNPTASQSAWVEPLLGPYIERRVKELIPGAMVAVVVERSSSAERRVRSTRGIQWALGKAASVQRRPDGKPEVGDEIKVEVSAAHADDLTLTVAGPGPLSCDVEPVESPETSAWRDLLDPDRFALASIVAREAKEDLATAATRVWTAGECLKKAGEMLSTPLRLGSLAADGWVLLVTGRLIISTCVARVRGVENRLVLAVLVRGDEAWPAD
jgi:enediyne polyketide synthase